MVMVSHITKKQNMIQEPPPEISLNESTDENYKTIKLETSGDNIIHYAALPSGKSTIDQVQYPKDPAYKYPFELDEFQKCAISCVHRNESVLVSAHTSAGKTAIAIYAIALALKNKSRIVYTSPIKALSNQKYKELYDEFHDVGLMTGDITINPSASVLVMTTEILRMMLFTGDALIREISWVIYDEVHYMKDPERGVVWEESIILLPDPIHYVFLSATIPNAREFSEWIAQLHNHVCHVVYTEHRPIPLRYYISPLGQTQNYLVRNADGEIIETSFNHACDTVNVSAVTTFKGAEVKTDGSRPSMRPSRKAVEAHTCQMILQMVKSDLYPMIVFVFSRKECDRIHESLGKRSFNAPEEKALVRQTFENAISKLSPEDRNLPQIDKILQLAERGIGIHHGGLIPLMKEIVEILFSFGLIKILFATETFAMGLNMPSKTVIFNDLYKFDGNERRLLATGEFIQMSGRAGRRNKDKFGVVSINYSGETPPLELKSLMLNAAQPLNSEFRVTFNMLLNIIQTTYLDPRNLMRKSFHQFQMVREIPLLKSKLEAAQEVYDQIILSNEEVTSKVIEIENKLSTIEEKIRNITLSEENVSALLIPGRILKIKKFEWSVCASTFQKKGSTLLVITMAEETKEKKLIKPTSSLTAKPHLIQILLTDIEDIARSALDISFDTISSEFTKKVMSAVQKFEKKGISTFDPLEYIKVGKENYIALQSEYEKLRNVLNTFSNIDEAEIRKFKQKQNYLNEIEFLTDKIKSLSNLVNQKDLDSMKKVLKRLNFIDENEIIQLKGRIATIITSANEIVLTELLLDGSLSDISPHNMASLMTVFVCDENGKNEDQEIPKELSSAWNHIQTVINKIATVSLECQCDIDVDKFKRSFSPDLMGLTLMWSNGISFSSLMETYSNLYEGSIIRSMKRLDELLNQLAKAADMLENKILKNVFEESSKLIKRGIISSASLYL